MSTPAEAAVPPRERSVMPVVARAGAGLPTWALIALAALAGLLLFGVLDARRRALSAPAVAVRSGETIRSETPPALYVPPEPLPTPVPQLALAPPPPSPPAPVIVREAPRVVVAPMPIQQPVVIAPPERPQRSAGGAALVFDASQPRADTAAGAAAGSAAASPLESNGTATRVRAGVIANRATTIPQGTMISAVLETAFNSTRAGFARALVQRDVRGFDGSRVLIPRGSRLIGEYRSDATAGQNRALINWTRLIRPDGATIAIGSPATDTVGTNGIRAKVNSHFFERFAGAILQSVLDIGVNLASRSADSPVIVALPNSLQNSTNTITTQTQIPPTLKVRQGTSVSVFVARDLDFTEVEQTP